MDVHIMDLFTIPTWKMGNICLPVGILSTIASYIRCHNHNNILLQMFMDVLNLYFQEHLASKDAIVIPAWSRLQDAVDHYILCVQFQLLIFIHVFMIRAQIFDTPNMIIVIVMKYVVGSKERDHFSRLSASKWFWR